MFWKKCWDTFFLEIYYIRSTCSSIAIAVQALIKVQNRKCKHVYKSCLLIDATITYRNRVICSDQNIHLQNIFRMLEIVKFLPVCWLLRRNEFHSDILWWCFAWQKTFFCCSQLICAFSTLIIPAYQCWWARTRQPSLINYIDWRRKLTLLLQGRFGSSNAYQSKAPINICVQIVLFHFSIFLKCEMQLLHVQITDHFRYVATNSIPTASTFYFSLCSTAHFKLNVLKLSN